MSVSASKSMGEPTMARREEAEPGLVILRAIFPQIPRFWGK